MQFIPFEDGIEVSGRAVNSIISGLGNLNISAKKYLLDMGIGEEFNGKIKIDLEKWYSQKNWLKAIENIAKIYGDAILYKIGSTIPDNAIFPDLGLNIENAIKSIDIAYHMNHRKNNKVMYDSQTQTMLEGIGHYGYRKLEGINIIVSECNNPYPCSFDKGIITEMAKKLNPNAVAMHDDSKPCRKNGADSCLYIIAW